MGLDNPIHLVILLVILLMVFGAKRLPEMGRSLGSGLRGFKESINGDMTTMARIDEQSSTAGETPPIA
jgi:sec-independent protein translocase protein TatA